MKIKISAVSYLNTKPFLHGLSSMGLNEEVELQLDIPSVCAKKLINKEVDLGLIPVAVIPELTTPHIISDYCIGTNGMVKTVNIFAHRPIHQLKRIYLDYQSRTSVQLAQILLKKYWKVSPELIPAHVGYERLIQGDTGGLVIGDRAIDLLGQFPYIYDLGSSWRGLTQLPFVFAAWVSNGALPQKFISRFNQALELGIDRIDHVAKILQPSYPTFDVDAYFTRFISYKMDVLKKKALSLFLKELRTQNGGFQQRELVFMTAANE